MSFLAAGYSPPGLLLAVKESVLLLLSQRPTSHIAFLLLKCLLGETGGETQLSRQNLAAKQGHISGTQSCT